MNADSKTGFSDIKFEFAKLIAAHQEKEWYNTINRCHNLTKCE